VSDLLRFSRLKENPAHKGFVKDEQYAVLAACATELWLKGLLATGYEFGFRSSELTGLKVGHVDLKSAPSTLIPATLKMMKGARLK